MDVLRGVRRILNNICCFLPLCCSFQPMYFRFYWCLCSFLLVFVQFSTGVCAVLAIHTHQQQTHTCKKSNAHTRTHTHSRRHTVTETQTVIYTQTDTNTQSHTSTLCHTVTITDAHIQGREMRYLEGGYTRSHPKKCTTLWPTPQKIHFFVWEGEGGGQSLIFCDFF